MFECRICRRDRVERRRVETRHGAVLRRDQQHDLGTAEDDPLRAALDQMIDDALIGVARLAL